jgi:hypothetical protein
MQFMLSCASSRVPLYTLPFFNSTVTIPPIESCKRMIGIPAPLLPVTDTEMRVNARMKNQHTHISNLLFEAVYNVKYRRRLRLLDYWRLESTG